MRGHELDWGESYLPPSQGYRTRRAGLRENTVVTTACQGFCIAGRRVLEAISWAAKEHIYQGTTIFSCLFAMPTCAGCKGAFQEGHYRFGPNTCSFLSSYYNRSLCCSVWKHKLFPKSLQQILTEGTLSRHTIYETLTTSALLFFLLLLFPWKTQTGDHVLRDKWKMPVFVLKYPINLWGVQRLFNCPCL